MSLLSAVIMLALLQGVILWGAIRLVDPGNPRNRLEYAFLIALGLGPIASVTGTLMVIFPLLVLGLLLTRAYELDFLRTVGVILLLCAGNVAAGFVLEAIVEIAGPKMAQALLLVGASVLIGRSAWRWRRGDGAARATAGPTARVRRRQRSGKNRNRPVRATPTESGLRDAAEAVGSARKSATSALPGAGADSERLSPVLNREPTTLRS